MKRTAIFSAVGIATCGLLSAQGLYNIMPSDDEPEESLPLEWTVNAGIGWDSNPSPTFSECSGFDSDEALYLTAAIQGNFVSRTPQTTWDIWGRVGAIYYLDQIEQTINAAGGTVTTNDEFYPNFRGGINMVHRVNERLRIRSRNHAAYELEPDYDYGIATDRRQGNYVRYSSDTSVGYRWTERLGTETGYRLSGVTFIDVDGEDYIRHLFYNQFRYRSSPSTVLTAAYRIQFQDNDSSGNSVSHYFLVGAEHELSPTTVVVIRGGAQFFDPDGGDTSWSPYVEGMLRAALSEAASARVFVRYGVEDRNRTVAVHDCGVPLMPVFGVYDTRRVLRIGSQGSYVVSPRLTFFGGVNVIWTEYDDRDAARSGPTAPSDLSSTVFNVNVGASFEVYDNVYATASYNFTDSNDDADIRDYDRHRVQVGVQANF